MDALGIFLQMVHDWWFLSFPDVNVVNLHTEQMRNEFLSFLYSYGTVSPSQHWSQALSYVTCYSNITQQPARHLLSLAGRPLAATSRWKIDEEFGLNWQVENGHLGNKSDLWQDYTGHCPFFLYKYIDRKASLLRCWAFLNVDCWAPLAKKKYHCGPVLINKYWLSPHTMSGSDVWPFVCGDRSFFWPSKAAMRLALTSE